VQFFSTIGAKTGYGFSDSTAVATSILKPFTASAAEILAYGYLSATLWTGERLLQMLLFSFSGYYPVI
jgi:hypothetical protein